MASAPYFSEKKEHISYRHLLALVGLVLLFVLTFSLGPLSLLFSVSFGGLPLQIYVFGIFPILLIVWLWRMRVQIKQIGWRAYLFPEPLEK
jgi:hypothetical protein